jgi:hypothetical protein
VASSSFNEPSAEDEGGGGQGGGDEGDEGDEVIGWSNVARVPSRSGVGLRSGPLRRASDGEEAPVNVLLDEKNPLSAQMVGAQLTLLASWCFANIRPHEFVTKKRGQSPNVKRMVSASVDMIIVGCKWRLDILV